MLLAVSLPLLHPVALITATALDSLALTTDPAEGESWPAFIGAEPDTPDNVVTLYDTRGLSDGRFMVDGWVDYHHALQVRIRSRTQSVGFIRAAAIKGALESIRNRTVVIDETRYLIHCYSSIGDVLFIGQDTHSARMIHVVNSLVAVTRKT